MDAMIKEINAYIKKILDDLFAKKEESAAFLAEVEGKIAKKIDEAKLYKSDVEDTKAKIKELESEIANLEIDLNDLNDRFGKKDLTAILEAGNREINAKIIDKQNQITKHRQKIGELTEKARSIKDLLINLRKDKTTKQEKLEVLTKTYDYYQGALNKVMDFAKANPNNLEMSQPQPEPVYEPYETYTRMSYVDSPIIETGIFEEIESMDGSADELVLSAADEDEADEPAGESEGMLGLALNEVVEDAEAEEPNLDDLYEKLSNKNIDLQALNASIEKEYSDLFGESKNAETFISEAEINAPVAELIEPEINALVEPAAALEVPVEVVEDESLMHQAESASSLVLEPAFNIDLPNELTNLPVVPDIFSNNLEVGVNTETPNAEITSFFTEQGLAFNEFDAPTQEKLKNVFEPVAFKTIIEVLKNNRIDLENLEHGANILNEIPAEELTQIISKLLLANQTTEHIGLILGSLSGVTSTALSEVIESFGPAIKDANITEIIAKASNSSSSEIDYLTNIGFIEEEISNLKNTLPTTMLTNLANFPQIITINYNYLKEVGISNIKKVFTEHANMFLMNPNRFDAIFNKYDRADLIRCLEKNAAVIEKL